MAPTFLSFAPLAATLGFLPPTAGGVPSDAKPVRLANAYVEVGDGSVLRGVSVVLNRGVIQEVSPSVDVGADGFELLDVEGMVVTPAFIDAYSLLMTAEKKGSGDADDSSGGRGGTDEGISFALDPLSRRGLNPRDDVLARLEWGENQRNAHRSAGFATLLVAPLSDGWSGSSAAVRLVGGPISDALLDADAWQHVSLRPPSGGGYPSTLMGVLAHYRQFLGDAERNRRAWDRYQRKGQAVRRPRLDLDYEAVWPNLDGEQPVAIEADSVVEIDAALAFALEFGLRPILIGGSEVGRRIDSIRRAGASVVIGLDYPDPQPGLEEACMDHAQHLIENEESGRVASRGDAESDRKLAPQRVREDLERSRRERIRGAQQLSAAGIPFGFSSRGLKRPEQMVDGLRVAVAEGLDRNAALRGLTSQGARMLGVQQVVGRIAPGMAATVAIFDGDPFEEGTSLRHLFVDGVRFDYEPRRRNGSGDKSPASVTGLDLTGSWEVRVELDGGIRTYRFELHQEEDRISGGAQAASGAGEIAAGSITGDRVRFAAVYSFGDRRYEFQYEGTIEGDTMSGTVSINGGQGYPWSGNRIKVDARREEGR